MSAPETEGAISKDEAPAGGEAAPGLARSGGLRPPTPSIWGAVASSAKLIVVGTFLAFLWGIGTDLIQHAYEFGRSLFF
jgi:hypothetical protein